MEQTCQRPPTGRHSGGGVGEGIVGKGQSGRACAEPASGPSAPRSGGGAQRGALTPVSTRARCWPDDAAGDHNILRSVRVRDRPVLAVASRHDLFESDLPTSPASGAFAGGSTVGTARGWRLSPAAPPDACRTSWPVRRSTRGLAAQGSSHHPEAVSFPAAWSGRQRHQVKESDLHGDSDVSALVGACDHRRHGVRAIGRACDAGGPVSNALSLPCSHRSSCCAMSTTACLRNAHSQTIATRQPAWSRSCRLRRSRSVFASNLARQNPRRVAGVVAYGQLGCRCQKQPCTKHTARNRRNTRSGVPGRLRSCRRYRSPRAWTARRSASSGRVSLPPIPAIMRERVARSTMSAIVFPCTDPGGARETTGYTRGPGRDATRRDAATMCWTGLV